MDMGSLAHNANMRHGANTAVKQGALHAGMPQPGPPPQQASTHLTHFLVRCSYARPSADIDASWSFRWSNAQEARLSCQSIALFLALPHLCCHLRRGVCF